MGGGKVGGYLARELRAADHAVIVIEIDQTQAERVAEETGALTINGNGTDLDMLGEIEIRRSDFFVAVTGADEDNLVACQLTKAVFGVERVLARLNDPRNRPTFDALGIPVVSVTDLLVQVISRELDLRELVRVALLDRGEVSLFEVEIPPGTSPRPLSSFPLPAQVVVAAVLREGETVVPTGATSIAGGDHVLVVTRVELEDEARDALLAGPTAPSAAEGPDIVKDA
jgi:trk system potassium uptake protein TrkA